MKNTVKFFSLVFIMVLFSCSNEPIIDASAESIAAEQLLVKMNNVEKSTVKVEDHNYNFMDGTSSIIHRKNKGIKVKFKTENLIPGNAYTLWFVIFGETPGPPTSTYAGGLVVGQNGKANFSAHKSAGEIFENGTVFNNPLTAEVHLALRTHGPAIPGMTELQITTMNGGCTSGFPSGPSLHPDSNIEGYCANVQVAKHFAID